mgnify:CR=1 FL=1
MMYSATPVVRASQSDRCSCHSRWSESPPETDSTFSKGTAEPGSDEAIDGDLHGDLAATRAALRLARLIDGPRIGGFVHDNVMASKRGKLLLNVSNAIDAAIGREVGLSAAAIHARVKKLTATGVIQRFTVQIDHAALGLDIAVITRHAHDRGVDRYWQTVRTRRGGEMVDVPIPCAN